MEILININIAENKVSTYVLGFIVSSGSYIHVSRLDVVGTDLRSSVGYKRAEDYRSQRNDAEEEHVLR